VKPLGVLVAQDEAPVATFTNKASKLPASRCARRDGAESLQMTRSSDFDLVILDLVLPEMSPEEVLARIRGEGSHVPMIVLTTKDAVTDRVANLDAVADDYLTKPFSFDGLLARVSARLRTTDQTDSTTVVHGRVMLDLHTRRVRIDGRSVELTAREFALLETLMRHAGEVLSRQQLLDHVWGWDREP
jgi:two-component system copper resistance phosphate regulon response regulator CusR